MADETNGNGIRYTVRETIEAIQSEMRAGFSSISTKLDSKANQADYAEMAKDLDVLKGFRMWVLGGVGAIVITIGIVVSLLAAGKI